MLGRSSIVWLGSLLVHAGLALSVGAISPVQEAHAPTKITIREIKRPKAEPPAPPPPEVPAPPAPPPEVAAPAKPPRPPKPTAAAPAPVAAAAPTAPGPAVPSFGLTLSGGTGSGGIAVAAPSALQPTAAPASTRPPKALARAKPAADACSEALIKPKPLNMPQPVYARQAREANIAGKVRVELRVDALGQVASAKVLEGLGYGLDEAALEAARAARFEPATLCGRATETTFVIGMRFSL
jgi:protein TonB